MSLRRFESIEDSKVQDLGDLDATNFFKEFDKLLNDLKNGITKDLDSHLLALRTYLLSCSPRDVVFPKGFIRVMLSLLLQQEKSSVLLTMQILNSVADSYMVESLWEKGFGLSLSQLIERLGEDIIGDSLDIISKSVGLNIETFEEWFDFDWFLSLHQLVSKLKNECRYLKCLISIGDTYELDSNNVIQIATTALSNYSYDHQIQALFCRIVIVVDLNQELIERSELPKRFIEYIQSDNHIVVREAANSIRHLAQMGYFFPDLTFVHIIMPLRRFKDFLVYRNVLEAWDLYTARNSRTVINDFFAVGVELLSLYEGVCFQCRLSIYYYALHICSILNPEDFERAVSSGLIEFIYAQSNISENNMSDMLKQAVTRIEQLAESTPTSLDLVTLSSEYHIFDLY